MSWKGHVSQSIHGPYWVEPWIKQVNKYLQDHPSARVVAVIKDYPSVDVVIEEDVEPGYRESAR